MFRSFLSKSNYLFKQRIPFLLMVFILSLTIISSALSEHPVSNVDSDKSIEDQAKETAEEVCQVKESTHEKMLFTSIRDFMDFKNSTFDKRWEKQLYYYPFSNEEEKKIRINSLFFSLSVSSCVNLENEFKSSGKFVYPTHVPFFAYHFSQSTGIFSYLFNASLKSDSLDISDFIYDADSKENFNKIFLPLKDFLANHKKTNKYNADKIRNLITAITNAYNDALYYNDLSLMVYSIYAMNEYESYIESHSKIDFEAAKQDPKSNLDSNKIDDVIKASYAILTDFRTKIIEAIYTCYNLHNYTLTSD